MSSPVQIVKQSWPSPIPDWILVLAEHCQASSQNKVSKKIGRSSALISNVLHNKYPGDLAAFEERVRGSLMDSTIDCPALGNIPTNECQDWQKKSRKFAGVNSLRVRMYRACSSCPKSKGDLK